MATYIVLCNFTDQGIRTVKDTTHRAEAARKMAKKFGVNLREVFWTLGAYDLTIVCEAPDDAAATAFCLATGSMGNVRTQVMRGMNEKEMNAILGKLAETTKVMEPA